MSITTEELTSILAASAQMHANCSEFDAAHFVCACIDALTESRPVVVNEREKGLSNKDIEQLDRLNGNGSAYSVVQDSDGYCYKITDRDSTLICWGGDPGLMERIAEHLNRDINE